MYGVAAFVVFAPRLVIVVGSRAERLHDAGQVMCVFASYVLFDECDLSADAVVFGRAHFICERFSLTPSGERALGIDRIVRRKLLAASILRAG